MSDIELLLGLVAATVMLVWVARAINVPYPIFLVAGGLAIGFVPGVPEIELDPEVVFLLFIPPLVHASAYVSSPRHLRTWARPIGQMAILLVILTMGVTAVVAQMLIPELSWEAAFVLGAILAPTDLVAATAVYRRLGVRPHITTLVEGEIAPERRDRARRLQDRRRRGRGRLLLRARRRGRARGGERRRPRDRPRRRVGGRLGAPPRRGRDRSRSRSRS